MYVSQPVWFHDIIANLSNAPFVTRELVPLRPKRKPRSLCLELDLTRDVTSLEPRSVWWRALYGACLVRRRLDFVCQMKGKVTRLGRPVLSEK